MKSKPIKKHYPIITRVRAAQFADLERGQVIVVEMPLGEVVIESAKSLTRAAGRIEAASTQRSGGKLTMLLQIRNGDSPQRRRGSREQKS